MEKLSEAFVAYGEAVREWPPEEVEAFYAARRAEGLLIDPATAEVTWWHVWDEDPYDIQPHFLPDENEGCVGRGGFARRPGSDIWVHFSDLPDATAEVLYAKHKNMLHSFVI